MTIKSVSARRFSLAAGALSLLFINASFVKAQEESRSPTQPILSRDAKQIVFVDDILKRDAGKISLQHEIWIVNADATGKRQLTSGPADDHPRFSPDGQKIAFTRDNDVWIIHADGSGLKNVTNTKSDVEIGAEFTNDGKLLVFVRMGAQDADEATKAEIKRKEPMAAFGLRNLQSVVLHDLETGVERALLGNGYDVSQVATLDWDSNVVFLLCRPVDNDGKPIGPLFFKSQVAVLRLDGSLPRMIFQLKADSKYRLQSMRIRHSRNLFEVDLPDKIGKQVGYLKDGELVILPDAPALGDLSSGGNTIIGTGVFDDTFKPGIVFFDIETGESWPLFPAKNKAR